MGPLVDQGDRIGDRVIWRQYDRRVGHQVAALDKVHGPPHGLDRKILWQDHDPAAAGHRLRHPPARDRGHVRHHHRNGGATAVRGRQVDVEAGYDVRAARDDEDVVVGQVVKRSLTVQETHLTSLVRPVPGAANRSDPDLGPVTAPRVWNRALGSASMRP